VSADNESQRPPYEYDVAISFAGAERPLAEQLARILRNAGFAVFYDDFYPEKLWGTELTVFLDEVYRNRSHYCVIFVSHEYAARIWTNHERRSAQARALLEKGYEYILPIEVEPVGLPGMPPTIARLPLSKYSIADISQFLIQKLRASGMGHTSHRSNARERPSRSLERLDLTKHIPTVVNRGN
jgi:hypothetical protein